LLRLRADPEARLRTAAGARAVFEAHFSVKALGTGLRELLRAGG
jgi:hypothetical protein